MAEKSKEAGKTSLGVDAVVMRTPTIEEALKQYEEGNVKVKFKDGKFGNLDLFLVHGAITTQECFEQFIPGPTHLYENGEINE